MDIDKFVVSLIEFSPQQSMKYIKALADQGLKYKDGEIVEIEQEQPYNKPLFFEKGKWYTCIAKVNGFKVGHTYQSKMEGTVSNDSGAMYMYHNDVNFIFRPATEEEIKKGGELRKWLDFGKTHEGTTITIPKDLKGTDTDGGVVGEKGEQGEQPTNKNFKERYENIAKSDWFKKTHKDISIGEEQLAEEEMVGMGGLGKVWSEQAIISRLDKIIELLQSAILLIPRGTYVPTTIYKNPLDPDPNTLGGWETTASTEGGEE